MGMVAKTDDEIYVLSTIKIYSHFSFVFSAVSKKVKLLKILKVTKLLPRYENGTYFKFWLRPRNLLQKFYPLQKK